MLNLQTLGIAVGLSVLIAFTSGWKVASWKADAKISDMVEQAQKAAEMAREKSDALEAVLSENARLADEMAAIRAQKQRVKTEYIDREVIVYAQNDDIERCDMANHFVRIHDESAEGNTDLPEIAAGERELDASPSGITDVEAIATISSNYGVCNELRNQVISLQDYIRSLEPYMEEMN